MSNSNTQPFNLSKGDRFNLTKQSGGDTAFYIGLSWDAPDTKYGITFDLDASLFACGYDYRGENPKIVSNGHFIYFGQLVSSDGAIHHSGDNLTGDGDGDDEQIRVFLDRLDPRVEVMPIVVTIYEALKKRQNFGQVLNAKIRMCKMDAAGEPTEELFQFNLTEDYSKFTAIHFGDIYRDDDKTWRWHSQGVGFERTEINDIVKIYTNQS